MITLQVPYYYVDSLYVTGIVALFIMFIMFSKILLLLKENRSLRTLCRNQQEYCNKINPDKILNYFGIDIIKISLPKNLKNLSVEDIRLILIELINQKISIKDNNYVMERMSVYACKPTLIEIVTALKNDLN